MSEQSEPSNDARLARVETKLAGAEQNIARMDQHIVRLTDKVDAKADAAETRKSFERLEVKVDAGFRWLLGTIGSGVALILGALYFTAQHVR